MSHLLDTDICIALIRRRSPLVAERLRQQPVGTVSLSAITVAELAFGAEKSARPEENRRALAQFLLPFVVAPFDTTATAAYGRLRAALERLGTPIGPLDCLIAAHAQSLGHTLVTANEREFGRIPDLAIENWHRAR